MYTFKNSCFPLFPISMSYQSHQLLSLKLIMKGDPMIWKTKKWVQQSEVIGWITHQWHYCICNLFCFASFYFILWFLSVVFLFSFYERQRSINAYKKFRLLITINNFITNKCLCTYNKNTVYGPTVHYSTLWVKTLWLLSNIGLFTSVRLHDTPGDYM